MNLVFYCYEFQWAALFSVSSFNTYLMSSKNEEVWLYIWFCCVCSSIIQSIIVWSNLEYSFYYLKGYLIEPKHFVGLIVRKSGYDEEISWILRKYSYVNHVCSLTYPSIVERFWKCLMAYMKYISNMKIFEKI